jgi:HAE1 family hydrophobic/amphiphilic exporter-1
VNITSLSIKRPVTIVMIMIALVLIGAFAVFKLPQDLYPSLNLPVATVITSWSGASPAEVEQQVTNQVEQSLQSLSGVSEMDAQSTQGSSLVIVQFDYGVNIDNEVNQIRSIIAKVQPLLPSDAGTPSVEQFDPSNLPIMTLSLYGNVSQAALSDLANNQVQSALAHLKGVSSVSMAGALTRQITVQVDPQQLAHYNLSIGQVVQAVSSDNLQADAGTVQKGSLLIPLHINGQFTSPDQLANIPISLASGGTVRLGAVAKIVNGYKDVNLISTVNGQGAVGMQITQATGSNTVAVSDEVNQAVSQLQKQLPAGVHLRVLTDSAQTIRDTIHTVITHTLLGFLFGALIILLILRSVRTTLVIVVAIPIAVLSTFILMYATHLTLNSITLGSLAVGLGSLVDFSIVVLESIFRARQRKLGPIEAAHVGTREVGLAVFVAALAQISVFAPSIFVPGVAGQFMRPLSLTVSFSHVAALFVAMTLTPMMASRLLRGSRFEQEESVPGITSKFRAYAPFDWFGRGMHDVTRAYRASLVWSLNHRKTVVSSALVLLVASLAMVPLIGFELVPQVSNSELSVSLTLANGTDLNTTNSVVKEIEALAQQHLHGIKTVYAQVGGASSENKASIDVKFKSSVSGAEVNKMAHDFGTVTSTIPGAKIIVSAGSANTGPGGSGIQVQIQGPDLNTLRLLSTEVADAMRKTPGLEYVNNQATTGTPDYQLNINQAALQAYGVTEQQVMSTLRSEYQGTKASSFYQGNHQYDIVVRLPKSFSQNLDSLAQVTVQNSRGQSVPVQQVATLTTSQEAPQINDVNGVRTVIVSATPYGVTSGRAQAAVAQALKSIHVPAGYYIGFGQNGKFLVQALTDLGIAVLFSILLLYMIMASLFESLLTPFVIMFSLPPTFIGGALGLLLTHRSLNINSAIGVIMVMGLIANNAIVLVDYTNQLRRTGLSLRKALLQAGPIRLRPIVMSTLTTVLAMMPLVIGYGKGAETLASMATVIAFGLVFSTLVTLVLVPVVYVIFDNWIEAFKRWRERRRTRRVSTVGMEQGPGFGG